MSDVNTGVGAFPTSAQLSGGGWWPKANAAGAEPRLDVDCGQPKHRSAHAHGYRAAGGERVRVGVWRLCKPQVRGCLCRTPAMPQRRYCEHSEQPARHTGGALRGFLILAPIFQGLLPPWVALLQRALRRRSVQRQAGFLARHQQALSPRRTPTAPTTDWFWFAKLLLSQENPDTSGGFRMLSCALAVSVRESFERQCPAGPAFLIITRTECVDCLMNAGKMQRSIRLLHPDRCPAGATGSRPAVTAASPTPARPVPG